MSQNAFLSGQKPAIDVGLSVSRVGSSAQQPGIKLVSEGLKMKMAQFNELQSFAQFASDLGQDTQDKIYRGQIVNILFKQVNGNPIPTNVQAAMLSIAESDAIHEIPVAELEPVIKTFTLLLRNCSWLLLYCPTDLIFFALYDLSTKPKPKEEVEEGQRIITFNYSLSYYVPYDFGPKVRDIEDVRILH